MFVTIIGKEGTRQTIGNATGMNVEFGRNFASVSFFDGQGPQTMPYELSTIESIMWSRENPVNPGVPDASERKPIMGAGV